MSPNRRTPSIAALAVALALVSGCSSSSDGTRRSGIFEPYRIDLPQGNYLTQEMLAQVRTGMSREQVRAAIGAPLLESIFRDDRWDYVFRYKHADGTADLRRVRIVFKDNRVASIDTDPLPEREDISDPALPGFRARPQVAPPVVDPKRGGDTGSSGVDSTSTPAMKP